MSVCTNTSARAATAQTPLPIHQNKTKSGFPAYMRWIFLLMGFVALGINVKAQTQLIPAANGSFESAVPVANPLTDFTANGWTVVNGASNRFFVGTAAVPSAGTYSAFTGPNATTWSGEAATTVSHIYRDFTIPPGESVLTLSFKYKISAVDATFDFVKAFIIPTTTTPVAGTQLLSSQGQIGVTAGYDGTTSYATYTIVASGVPGTTQRLVLSYRSDGVSPHGAASLDEISLISAAPVSFTATANGGLWSSPATWVGGVVPGPGNDITIPTGSVVTVDQATNYRNLTINGILQWNGTANAMTITNDLIINSGGSFLPYTSASTPAGFTINVGGNFTNDGFANLSIPSTLLNFNGSTAGGSLAQVLGGSGVFAGNGSVGLIRAFFLQTTGSTTISTTQNLVTGNFAHGAGSLNTNGKLSLDNTAQLYGQALNRQVANIAVTNMGSGYTTQPKVFGATVLPYVSGGTVTTGNRYFNGNNVYLALSATPFGATPPTFTTPATIDATSGPNLLYLGTLGQLGTPYLVGTVTAGTQYAYNGNLYTCTIGGTTTAVLAPVHTSGTALVGATAEFIYAGTAATATVNWDGTSTVRSLTITSPGAGYYTAAPAAVISPNVVGVGSGASATSVLIQSVAGLAASSTQKSAIATISGGINIKSDQSVGAVSTTAGGIKYSAAPSVGFALPTGFLNLVTAGGSGYTAVPTITLSGGTRLTGGTDPTFSVVVTGGKVTSVICTGGGTLWQVPPTLTVSGGGAGTGATAAFPANCLATATATITDGTITNFTVTNGGAGYVSAPTVGLVTNGTVVTAATAPSCRLGLYNLVLGFFAPAPSNTIHTETGIVPSNRRINALTMNSAANVVTFDGVQFTGNLEFYGSAPLTLTAGVIDMGANTLTFSHPSYAGVTSTLSAGVPVSYVKGKMTLSTPGGSLTRTFPFETGLPVIMGTGSLLGGSTITSLSAQITAAPSGSGAIGSRAYLLNSNGGAYGINPQVTMNWNATDALTGNMENLYISQSANLSGPWVPRSLASSTGAITATGTRTTATTVTGPIVPTGVDYLAWTNVQIDTTNVTVQPGTCTATAHLVSADVTTNLGSISGVTITYNNGTLVSNVAMTNTVGNTWQFTIPAASPSNALVTWSITATTNNGITKSFNGKSYQDDALNGVTVSASASVSPVCSGSPSTLTATILPPTIKVLGAGASTSTSTAASFFPGGWGGAKTQYIIRASEMTGFTAGAIKSLAFEATTSGQTYQGFTVQMGNTAATVMTTTFLSTPMTQVYKGTLANEGYTPIVGVNTLAFGTGAGSSSTFSWDGTSNIVISICWSSVPSASTSTASSLKVDAVGFVSSAYDQTDAVTPATECATSIGDGTGSNRPKFTLVFAQEPIVSYTWNDGTSDIGTGNPFQVNPTSSTTYTVKAATASGCEITSAPVTVNTTALPSPPETNPSTQCGTGVPTCDALGTSNGNFRWYTTASGGTAIPGEQNNVLGSYSISTTTTFYVSIFDGTCESQRIPVVATVNAPDAVSATSDGPVCANSPLQLTATVTSNTNGNVYTYSWSAPAGSGITGSTAGGTGTFGTPASISVTPTTAGTYTYTVNASDVTLGCATLATVTVVVKPQPLIASATATPPAVCAGSSVTLNGVTNFSTPGNATVGTGILNNAATSTTLTGYPAPFGNYYQGALNQMLITSAELTAAGLRAGNITSIAFDVFTPFTTTLNGFNIGLKSTALTALNPLALETGFTTVFGPGSYTPSATPGYAANTITLSTPFNWDGTSNIIVQTCFANTGFTTNAVFNQSTTAYVSTLVYRADATTVCSSPGAPTFSYSQRPNMRFAGQVNATGAGTYNWVWNPGALTGNNISTIPAATTTYTLTATDPATGCSIDANVAVTVNAVPDAPTGTPSLQCGSGIPNASVSSNSNETTPIFKWYTVPTGGTALQTNTSTTYLASISSPTTFYVSEITAAGCEGERVAVLADVVSPDPVVANASATDICIGVSVDLTTSHEPVANEAYAYTWTASPEAGSGITGSIAAGEGETTTVTPTTAGTYTYTVNAVDASTNCTTFSTVIVTVHALPVIDSVRANPSLVCAGETVNLKAYSTGGTISGPQTVPSGYCTTGLYSSGCAAFGDYIASVNFAGVISRTSTCDGNYSSYSTQVPTLTAGSAYPIAVGTTSNDVEGVTVWIDYNRNGIFEASEAAFTPAFANVAGVTYSGSITIPVSASAGRTMMRVRMNYNEAPAVGNACVATASWGETEDYVVNILGVQTQNPALTYTWNPGALVGANVSVNPTTTTTYTVSAADAFACAGTGTVTVTVNPLPNAPSVTPSTQCGQGVPTASVTSAGGGGNGTFNWYANASGGTALQSSTSSTYTTSISTTTTFYVSESGTNGCESNRTAVTVTVTPPPTLVITPGGATTFCAGGNVILNGSSNSDVSYTNFSWTPTTGLTPTSGAIVNAAPLVTTTYLLTANDGIPVTGCTNTATITITVNPNPLISSVTASATTICVGGNSTLTATSISAVTGTAPVGSANTTTQGGSPFRAGGGSAARTQLLYTAAELTAAGFAPGNFTSIGFNFTAGSGGGLPNFQIKMGNTAATALTSTFEASPSTVVFTPTTVNPPTGTGVFTLTFTNPFTWNGTSNVLIEFCHDTPTGAAGSGSVDANTTAAIQTNQLLTTSACTVNTGGLTQTVRPIAILGGQIGSDVSGSFNWTWNPGAISGNPVPVSPTSTTVYTVTATNPVTNCFTVGTTQTVTVNVVPVGANATATPSTPVCAGTSVTLSAGATGGAPFTYAWSDGTATVYPTTATIAVTPTVTTTYTVTVTDACSNPTTSSVTVNVNPLPSAGIQEAGPIAICFPATQVLTATTDAASPSYQWTLNGTNIPSATGATYTVTGVSTGTYRVIVTNTATNCVSAPSAGVSVTINPKPGIVTVTPPTSSICLNGSQSLTASGGTTGGAGNATLGTATTLTSASDQPTAFCNRWAQYWNQTIYTAAELSAAGLTAGTSITSVSYFTTSQGDANNNTNFSIRIGNTASSTFGSFQTTGFTTVFGPTTYTHSIGTNLITFSSPFVWNGTSNIILDVRHDGVDNLNNAITFFTAAADNKNIEAHTSTTSGTTDLQTLVANASVIPTTSNTRLNIVFGYSSLQNPTWSWVGANLNTNVGATVVASPTTTTTYTAIATNAFGCTNTGTATVTVVQPFVSATPGAVSGPTNVCPFIGLGNPAGLLTYSVPQGPVGTVYNWIVPPTTTLVSGQGTNTITLLVNTGFIANANKLIRVRATEPCGTISAERLFYLLAQFPNTPGPISGPTDACPLLGNSATYSVAAVPGASAYIWTAQSGTTITPAGAGPLGNTVTISFPTGFTTSAVTVQTQNDCGVSGIRSLTITRNNPSTPSLIAGPTNVCANIAPGGTPATYTVTNTPGTTYTWTVPNNVIGLTGQGTNTISFTYPAAFTGGTVQVLATNGCGTSGTRSLSVTKLNPATPSVIDVIQAATCPDRVFTYTIAGMPANATSVQWTVPTASGAILVSGQGTTSITVSYPATAVQGVVTAQAVNNCGVSVTRESSVKLPACPPPTFTKGTLQPTTTPVVTVADMQVDVFPNPTVSDFKLRVLTASKEIINVRVLDAAGRAFKQFTLMPYETMSLGKELRAGAYIIEVRQGKEMKSTKVLKF